MCVYIGSAYYCNSGKETSDTCQVTQDASAVRASAPGRLRIRQLLAVYFSRLSHNLVLAETRNPATSFCVSTVESVVKSDTSPSNIKSDLIRGILRHHRSDLVGWRGKGRNKEKFRQ